MTVDGCYKILIITPTTPRPCFSKQTGNSLGHVSKISKVFLVFVNNSLNLTEVALYICKSKKNLFHRSSVFLCNFHVELHLQSLEVKSSIVSIVLRVRDKAETESVHQTTKTESGWSPFWGLVKDFCMVRKLVI